MSVYNKLRCREVVRATHAEVAFAFEGRNEFAIEVISKQLAYLTWDEAFCCLREELLPDSLRAKYCKLIIGELAHHALPRAAATTVRSVLRATIGNDVNF